MEIVFAFEHSVAVWLNRRGRVETPRPLSCPSCGHGWLIFNGWRPRKTRWGRVFVHRVLCANEGCGQRSHSLLPDVFVSGCSDLVVQIGQALERKAAGEGHRRIAAGFASLGVSESTVRRWLRRVSCHGAGVAALLLARAAEADPAVRDPPSVSGGPVAVLVGAVKVAGVAFSSLSGEPVDPWRYAVRVTGGHLLG